MGEQYQLAEKAQMKAVGFILCWVVVVGGGGDH